MRRLLFFTVVLICFTKVIAQTPDGPFKIIESQYGGQVTTNDEIKQQTIIKIFKRGYWISAFFGDPQKPFNGCGGGTYMVKDGMYVETLNYYSWDSTAVGQTFNFDYDLSGNYYQQQGYINSNRYQHYLIKEKFEKITSMASLQDSSLEGVWQMQTGDWGTDKLGEGAYKDVTVIKIYAYPRFAFAYFRPKDKTFLGAGGGTYQFDGKKLEENIEYWSWGSPKFPHANFKVMLDGNRFKQEGWDNGLTETFKRLQ